MKLTTNLLKKLDACSDAIQYTKALLPIWVNTDVDKNIDVAIKIIDYYTLKKVKLGCRCAACRRKKPISRTLIVDLRWLVVKISDSYRSNSSKQSRNIYEFDFTSWNNEKMDPLVIAQMLSWAADTYDN
jgi:hypothetical protein